MDPSHQNLNMVLPYKHIPQSKSETPTASSHGISQIPHTPQLQTPQTPSTPSVPHSNIFHTHGQLATQPTTTAVPISASSNQPKHRRTMPEGVSSILKDFFTNTSPNPTKSQKDDLVQQVKMFEGYEGWTRKQCENWFSAQRIKYKKRDGGGAGVGGEVGQGRSQKKKTTTGDILYPTLSKKSLSQLDVLLTDTPQPTPAIIEIWTDRLSGAALVDVGTYVKLWRAKGVGSASGAGADGGLAGTMATSTFANAMEEDTKQAFGFGSGSEYASGSGSGGRGGSIPREFGMTTSPLAAPSHLPTPAKSTSPEVDGNHASSSHSALPSRAHTHTHTQSQAYHQSYPHANEPSNNNYNNNGSNSTPSPLLSSTSTHFPPAVANTNTNVGVDLKDLCGDLEDMVDTDTDMDVKDELESDGYSPLALNELLPPISAFPAYSAVPISAYTHTPTHPAQAPAPAPVPALALGHTNTIPSDAMSITSSAMSITSSASLVSQMMRTSGDDLLTSPPLPPSQRHGDNSNNNVNGNIVVDGRTSSLRWVNGGPSAAVFTSALVDGSSSNNDGGGNSGVLDSPRVRSFKWSDQQVGPSASTSASASVGLGRAMEMEMEPAAGTGMEMNVDANPNPSTSTSSMEAPSSPSPSRPRIIRISPEVHRSLSASFFAPKSISSAASAQYHDPNSNSKRYSNPTSTSHSKLDLDDCPKTVAEFTERFAKYERMMVEFLGKVENGELRAYGFEPAPAPAVESGSVLLGGGLEAEGGLPVGGGGGDSAPSS